MTNRELKRALVLERLVKKDISTAEAAHLLRLSVRQVFRLKKRYLERGNLSDVIIPVTVLLGMGGVFFTIALSRFKLE